MLQQKKKTVDSCVVPTNLMTLLHLLCGKIEQPVRYDFSEHGLLICYRVKKHCYLKQLNLID